VSGDDWEGWTPEHFAYVGHDQIWTTNPQVAQVLRQHQDWNAALRELVEQGATDEEIRRGDWMAAFGFPMRRRLEAILAELRGSTGREPGRVDQPTRYALQMIPRVEEAYRTLWRDTHRAPSMTRTAEHAGIDRETIPEWVKRGWLPWPPPKVKPPAGR
jgi:hypothetical protein